MVCQGEENKTWHSLLTLPAASLKTNPRSTSAYLPQPETSVPSLKEELPILVASSSLERHCLMTTLQQPIKKLIEQCQPYQRCQPTEAKPFCRLSNMKHADGRGVSRFESPVSHYPMDLAPISTSIDGLEVPRRICSLLCSVKTCMEIERLAFGGGQDSPQTSTGFPEIS